MGSRRTEIKRHLPEQEIDEMLREAEDEHHLQRKQGECLGADPETVHNIKRFVKQ